MEYGIGRCVRILYREQETAMNGGEEVRAYYNNYQEKLIGDFLRPNRRIYNSINRAILRIPGQAKAILDLGCGLGWSSYEFARHFPHADVEGYDISEILYNTARLLFNRSNLAYHNLDLTRHFPDKRYDVVVLLDVFEHIGLEDRGQFYANISNCLASNGKVILTCPTVYHQEYLRQSRPDGLQPVDEDVDMDVLLDFARSVRGEISLFEYMNIWTERDYLIAEIRRYDTIGSLTYLGGSNLIGFYEKCILLGKNAETRRFLPPLSLKQTLRLQLNRILG